MRITKDSQSNINIISTIRNLNKLNPSHIIDLSNLHILQSSQGQNLNQNSSNPIKVKLMNQNINNNLQPSPDKKLPIDFIYKDQKKNLNKKEINDLRNSLIFTQEKNMDKNKENEFYKKISMSPKLTLRYNDDDININNINNDLNKNNKKPKMIELLSKNFAYNKKKPNNAFSVLSKKKSEEKGGTSDSKKINNNMNPNIDINSINNTPFYSYNSDDNISVASFRTDVNKYSNKDIMIQNNNNNTRKSQQYKYIKNNNNNNIIHNQNQNMTKAIYDYYNNGNNNFEIKSEDLIMLEERLNDISISLNNIFDVNDVGASNECIEFFVFYFHSSLSYKFPLLFQENKKILIQSAINLKLFTIVMTYHLSMNINILLEVLIFLKNIFSLLKNNLYLLIKKVQLFYGNEYVAQNEIYFKTFNFILMRNGFNKLNEVQICDLINKNCIQIAQYLSGIINYYEDIGNIYYLDFLDIFNNISKLTEREVNNYFYNYLYSAKSRGVPPKPKMEYHPLHPRLGNNRKNNYYINNQTINNYNNININTLNNINDASKNMNMNMNNLNQFKNKMNKDKLISDYLKNKISPPFLPSPCPKKYTLVFDIIDTLINLKYDPQKKLLIPNLRPGIFSILDGIKPFYELVSFTLEEKEFSDKIVNEIEKNKKYFDYNLYKDHATLHGNRLIKDISKLGRDIRRVIIVDDDENNFILNKENGIKIKPYLGEEAGDTSLFELKKILIMFEKQNLDDVRKGIKNCAKDIKEKISNNNLVNKNY